MGIFDFLTKQKIKIDRTPIVVPKKGMPAPFDKFPVLCIIIEKRGNSELIDFDWAGFRKDEVNEYYLLQKRKHTFKPPALQKVKLTVDGKNFMMLWSPSRAEYVPIDLIENPTIAQAMQINSEMRIWMVNEVKRVLNRSQGFLEKYMPIILLFMMIIVALIGIWIVYDALGEIVIGFDSSVNGLTSVLSKMTNTTVQSGAVW